MLYESPNFRLLAEDQVYTLWLDFRGRDSQRLSLASLNELSLLLDRVAALPSPAVLVIRSSRPGTFLEEFDSEELLRFRSPLEFAALVKRGQDLTWKLARFEFPTLALVEGRCTGAGLEIALACQYRLGVESARTQFESVEVGRGLIPAWGLTYRLPRLIGLTAAVRLMLEGEVIGAPAALQAGLLDRLTAPEQLPVALLSFVDALRPGKLVGWTRRASELAHRTHLALFGRHRLQEMLGKLTEPGADTLGAPVLLLKVVATGLASEGDGLAAERAAVAQLATREQTGCLLSLHRDARSTTPAWSMPRTRAKRIGIVGGGDLGSRLAAHLAHRGCEVIVQERSPVDAEQARLRTRNGFERMVGAGKLTEATSGRLAGAVRTTSNWNDFGSVELAIEAVYEDPTLKRSVFAELERHCRPRVIFATTSTTVPVSLLQEAVVREGRVAGLHFPEVAGREPIAEITASRATDPDAIDVLAEWASHWDFLPIRVPDRPGRLIELVRLGYLSEGVALVSEGLPADEIDRAARRFGMCRGPLEWCDAIGLDRVAAQAAQVQLARGDGFARNLLFRRLRPGAPVGGFYFGTRPARPDVAIASVLWQDLDEDAVASYRFDPDAAVREGLERLILQTINEAAASLDEPETCPADLDLALGLGMGWAPHRGGPLRYADELGLDHVIERLRYFQDRYGSRFRACTELVHRAASGQSFHGERASRLAALIPLKLAG